MQKTSTYYRAAISSHSLGRAWVHDLPSKLDQAARFGLDIELFFEDLEYFAESLRPCSTGDNYDVAARIIRSMCDDRGISIVCLQPFMHYEGLRDREHHTQKIKELSKWIQLAEILRTDIISIPSTFLPESQISGDFDLIVRDLREAAERAAIHNIRISFEALAWGTYINTWEQAWDVVKAVDCWNFGICLDTFNIAAKVFADPTAINRKTEHAEEEMGSSLRRLRNIDASKIFYVQVVDAEYLSKPLVEGHEYYNSRQHPRMSWSRNCRLFYGETTLGAYLPVKSILEAIFDTGFNGWISAELFNTSLTDPDSSVPREHAERTARSFRQIADDFGVDISFGGQKSRPMLKTRRSSSRAQL